MTGGAPRPAPGDGGHTDDGRISVGVGQLTGGMDDDDDVDQMDVSGGESAWPARLRQVVCRLRVEQEGSALSPHISEQELQPSLGRAMRAPRRKCRP